MKLEIPVTLEVAGDTLRVHADYCHGQIAIPASMERNEQNLQALAILALTPYARKVGAHMPWWGAAVADPLVQEFVDHANLRHREIDLLDYLLNIRDDAERAGSLDELRERIADTVLRATDYPTWLAREREATKVSTGNLRIAHNRAELRVTVDDEHEFAVALPANGAPMNRYDLLGWATIAATPLATKQAGHYLPEQVRDALQVVADYAMCGEVRHG